MFTFALLQVSKEHSEHYSFAIPVSREHLRESRTDNPPSLDHLYEPTISTNVDGAESQALHKGNVVKKKY